MVNEKRITGQEIRVSNRNTILSNTLCYVSSDQRPSHTDARVEHVRTVVVIAAVEWKRNLVAHGDVREDKWRGKRRMEWAAKQASVWLGKVHPVLLQSFSPDLHSKKASTRLNWHPSWYKWTRPFRWKTESGFCACDITFRLHSTSLEEYGVRRTHKVAVFFSPFIFHCRYLQSYQYIFYSLPLVP